MYDNMIRNSIIEIRSFESASLAASQDLQDCVITFTSVAIKNYFLGLVNRNVINANSSFEKFNYDMDTFYDKFAIFNNLKYCTDRNILSIIANTKNLCIE